MKKIIYLFFFTLVPIFTISQDIIYKNDKSEIKANVIEITEDLIKYKKYDQPDGPLRNINKSDVFIIIYKDGTQELFNQNNPVQTENENLNEFDQENATIYFVQYAAPNFEYFHNDKYIGRLNKKSYFVYECPPGKQVIWASSENKEILYTDLKPGGNYIIYIDATMGFWKNHVRLQPVDERDTELYNKALSMISSKSPVIQKQKEINDMNIRLSAFIREHFDFYNPVWKSDNNKVINITPDMDVGPLN